MAGDEDKKDKDKESFTGKLSTAWINSLDTDIKAQVLQLAKENRISINSDHLPARLVDDGNVSSLTGFLRALVSESSGKLKELSEAELSKVVGQLDLNRPKPDSNIARVCAPEVFGATELSKADLEEWRVFRKDTREGQDLNMVLDFLVSFHKREGQKYTESTLRENMFRIIPKHLISKLYLRVKKGARIQAIFDELVLFDKKMLSQDEIRTACEKLLSSTNDPLGAFEEIQNMMSSGIGDLDRIDDNCLLECKRYIKRVGGESFFNAVESMHRHCEESNFLTYYATLKRYFSSDLQSFANARRKVHNVYGAFDTAEEGRNDSIRAVHDHQQREILQEMKKMVEEVKKSQKVNNIPQINPPVQPAQTQGTGGPCFACGSTQHQKRDCPKAQAGQGNRNNQAGRNQGGFQTQSGWGNLMYADQHCRVHPYNKHTNRECYTQQVQGCPTHQGNHAASECRRKGTDTSPPAMGPNQGRHPNPYQPPPQTGPPMPLSNPPPMQLTNHVSQPMQMLNPYGPPLQWAQPSSQTPIQTSSQPVSVKDPAQDLPAIVAACMKAMKAEG
jgi:hypothetical protein